MLEVTASRGPSALKFHNARLFVAGQALSNIGTFSQVVALSLLVLQLTDSGLALGAVMAAQALPILLLAPWAGSLLDRLPLRRVLFVTALMGAVQAACLAVLAFTGTINLAWVFGLAIGLRVHSGVRSSWRSGLRRRARAARGDSGGRGSGQLGASDGQVGRASPGRGAVRLGWGGQCIRRQRGLVCRGARGAHAAAQFRAAATRHSFEQAGRYVDRVEFCAAFATDSICPARQRVHRSARIQLPDLLCIDLEPDIRPAEPVRRGRKHQCGDRPRGWRPPGSPGPTADLEDGRHCRCLPRQLARLGCALTYGPVFLAAMP